MILPASPSRPAIYAKGLLVLCAVSLCALCVETSAAFTPETAVPDAWAPFTQNPWIVPGSALDFSALRGTDAPAGRHGRVVAVGNHFEFEGLPGVPQRFYGINLCFSANYPETPEDARRFAANLARMGYNAVRIHHHDGAWSENRDRLDMLVAACVENGLYLTTDLYVSRRVKWRDCGIDRDGDFGGDDFKRIVYVHEGVFSNYCAFARAFLSHVNPYTGRSLAEEPALGWISLVNEDAFGWDVAKLAAIPEYQTAWRDFLDRMRAEKGGKWNDVPDAFPETADGSDLPARAYRLFIGDLWIRLTDRMRALLDSLGCRALVTSLNGGSFFTPEAYAARATYDYSDIHFYVDHPAFLGKSWSLPARVGNADILVRGPENRGVALPLEHRLLEKPFAVTEFDYCFPNPSRSGGALAAGTLAALQETDALWRFCWSHKKQAIATPEETAIESFDLGADPVRQAAERLFVALFLRRDVSPLHRTLAIRIPPGKLADISTTGPTKWGARDWCRWTGWFSKVGVTMSPDLPPGTIDGGSWPEVSAKKYRDSLRDIPADALPGDGQVEIDWTNGVLSVSVPRTCAVFGPNGTLRAGALEADIGAEPATVWATALDGETLADARRILIGHLRDVKNSGMEFEDETCRIMKTKGGVPLLARKATIRIALDIGDAQGGDISIWRLDQTGRRLGQIPFERDGGVVRFDAETVAADGSVSFFHEIDIARTAAISAVAQNPLRTWKVETDRPDAIYRCGETATFTVTLQSTKNLSHGLDLKNVAVKLDNFGPQILTNAVFDLSTTNSFSISGTLRKPGFLRIVLPGTKNHDADPCDFSAGFNPEKIRKGSPSPDDFDEFWAKAVRDFDATVPPDPQLVPVPEQSKGSWNYWRVSFAAPHGTRVYGFLSIPKDASAEKKYPVRINVPAAGTGPWTFKMDGDPNAIHMMMSVHPFDLPENQEENRRLQNEVKAGLKERYGTDDYTIAGMDVSREDYYFYRALLGINRAVDWIASRPEADLSNFTYSGTSQGGGFGLYLLGLNRHFTKGALFVPALADTMGCLAGRQSGWTNPLKDTPPGSKAGREKNAPYFDGANFASRIRCPVRVAVGFSDCTCAPCAVYAAYNEIRVADKAILHGIGMTHGCFRKFYDELGAWVRKPATPTSVTSPVAFSTPFGDGMVLQRGRPVPVWGTAAQGESVVVRFAGQEKRTTAGADGTWRVDLDPMPECAEGRELSVESATGGWMSIADVLVGEVWLVSGQSNCELPLVGANPHFSDRQGILVANMTHRPLIRFAKTATGWSAESRRELRKRAEWMKCLPENLRKPAAFSAMGIYFALDVFAETGVPIGLVGAYLGSTNIEPWIPREGFDGVPGAEWCRDWQTLPPGTPATNLVATGHVNTLNRQPSVMWNEMVSPWAPMAARGILWYQGCSNSSRGKDDGSGDWYRRMMHALYDSWSRAFENPSMRLYFVQLAPFDDWWDIQSCQAAFAAEEPNAAMVTTCDIGNIHDIHPNEKATIGKRLAALALRRDYGFYDLVADAPVLRQCIADGEKVRLDFSNASGWWLYNANWSVDVPFEIADEKGDWHPARLVNTVNGFTNTIPWKTKGAIDGGGTLVLAADGVASPAAVRHLRQRPWTGFLYSTDSGLPLGPFEAKVSQ